MPKISISYRRADTQDITGRIFDRLAQQFGKDSVFRDIDNIRPGIDFRTQIADALQETDVLLVIVGPKWLGRTKGAEARIDNEADPVRIEVELALKRAIPVIPVLVGGAKMPSTTQLPASIPDFAFRHAVSVDSGRDFDHHLSGLTQVLRQILIVEAEPAILKPAAPAGTPLSDAIGAHITEAWGLVRRRRLLFGGVALCVLALLVVALRPWTWSADKPATIASTSDPAVSPPTRTPATAPNAAPSVAPPVDKAPQQGGAKPDVAAAATIKFGLVAPTSGFWFDNYGKKPKAAMELAADLINNPRPDLRGFPFATNGGLPNLNGAKLDIVTSNLSTIFTSSSSSRRRGGSGGDVDDVVRRLIGEDHVVAIAGATTSGLVSATRTVTEQIGIPFVSAESSSSAQSFADAGWFFRINPADADIIKSYVKFLTDIRNAGRPVRTIGIICGDCTFFENQVKMLTDDAKLADLSIAINLTFKQDDPSDVPDPANPANPAKPSSDVADQVRQLKAANPDVVVFLGHMIQFQDFIKYFQKLDFRPRVVIVGGTAPSVPSGIFLRGVGDIAQGVLISSVFDPGRPGSAASKVNQLFRSKTGADLDDLSARNMQALFVLADAANRAGSNQPADIRKALQETDLKPDQLILGYQGVRFNAGKYNALASPFLVQLQGTSYVPVWPPQAARANLMYPFKGADKGAEAKAANNTEASSQVNAAIMLSPPGKKKTNPIDGMPFTLGDSYAAFKEFYQNAPAPSRSGGDSFSTVSLNEINVQFFFDKDMRLYRMWFGPRFKGSVLGIGIGDTTSTVVKKLGAPARFRGFSQDKPTNIAYDNPDVVSVAFQVSLRGEVDGFWLFDDNIQPLNGFKKYTAQTP